MNLQSKRFTGSFKALDETGVARVVFATLETIDHDGDWIEKGAFKNSKAVNLVPSHQWKLPPIGMATISEAGNEAIADIKFNLEMESAKEWYKSIKFNHENGINQEYSFGFDVQDSEFAQRAGKKVRVLKALDTFEVSPVLRGAGINTRTVDIKDYSGLQGTWESTQEAIRVAASQLLLGDREGWVSIVGTYPSSVIVCVYSYDDAGHESHHYEFNWTQNADGSVALSGQQEVDLQTVVVAKNLKLADGFARVLGEVKSLIDRSKALAAGRAKEGRALSRATRERLARVQNELIALLAETEPAPAAETETETAPAAEEGKSTDALFAEHLKLQSQLAEVLA